MSHDGGGLRTLVWVILLAATQSACNDDSAPASDKSVAQGATSNRAPTISGTPPTSARTNEPYAFQPRASDPDGDPVSFQVVNKPGWASFDAGTGRLAGTPSSTSTGRFPNIQIVVSDGRITGAIAPFDIVVVSTDATGSATLSWQPPTQNVDGSVLGDLAGYVIRYGTSLDTLDREIRIANPGVTSSVVEGLVPATWYFALSAFNAAGHESGSSAMVVKDVT
jgi:Putative Ig domain